MPVLKCEVLNCSARPTVELQGKFYCSIHAIEAKAEYQAITIKQAEEERVKAKIRDKK